MKRLSPVVLALGCMICPPSICHSEKANAVYDQGPPCAGDVSTPEYLQSIYHDYGALPNGRLAVQEDWQKSYVVITYNATTHKLFWNDYPGGRQGNGSEILLTGNSSFTPILYSRERILVRVCGLHFGGAVTTTPSSLSLVDNGFDIRNATAGPQPLGLLGPPVNPGGVPPPPVAGASDLAPQAVAYYREYLFLQSQLNLLNISASHDSGLSIAQELTNLSQDLDTHIASADSRTSVTRFNQLQTRVQQAVADIAGLQSNLTTLETNIGKTLTTDYTALATAIKSEQAQDTIDLAAVQTAKDELQKATTPADSAKAKTDVANAPAVVAKAAARQKARQQDLADLGAAGNSVESILTNDKPVALLNQLTVTRVGNPSLYTVLGGIFQKVNALHDNSDVTYLSVITPLVGNGVESIDISVQDSYQPFTLATLSIYGTPPTVTPSNSNASPTPSGMIQAQMTKPGKGGGGAPPGAAAPAAATTPGSPSPAATPGPAAQSSGNTPPSNPQTAGATGTLPDASVRIEVHRIANFNILAGFAVAHIPVRAYSPVTVSTAVTGGPAVGTYIITTQNDSWQTYGIAGIAWYIGGRDMYPMSTKPKDQTGVVGTHHHGWLKPSIVGGSSITSLGTAFFGPALEPKPGISIMALGVWGATSKLAPGLVACANLASCPSSAASPLPFTTVPTVSSHTMGLSFGITLDPSVWSLFKPSGP